MQTTTPRTTPGPVVPGRTVDTFLMTTNKANNDYDVPGGGVTSGSLPTERMVLLLQLGTMSQMVMRPRAGPGRCPTMARGITGRDRIIPSTRDGTGRSGTTAGNGKTGPRTTGLPVHHLPPELSLDLRPRRPLRTPGGQGLRRLLLPDATLWMVGMASGVGPPACPRRPAMKATVNDVAVSVRK